ncbi:MAG: efflux RND transporter periplasmic adaptor subunit [Opitutus sp.]|nr:efflux RND transporter periplasmic adaptor subunit [Opitutus sp.]
MGCGVENAIPLRTQPGKPSAETRGRRTTSRMRQASPRPGLPTAPGSLPSPFPVMKKLLVVLVLVAAAAAGWYYYSARSSAAEAPGFTTATVSRGDILQTVTATGQLDPVISVDVGSQISGLVKKLYVDFNSPVKKGDKLAEIDPATYQQRLRQAEANLAAAEASNRLQKVNTERIKSLHEQKLVTQQEYDQAVAQLQQSDAQLLTNRAAVENARVDLDRCTISSPIDGIVMNKQTEEGKTVAASLNAPVLFTIANDLTKMQIAAAVAEADVGSVATGQQVTFTVDAFPGRTFHGEVTQVRNAPKTANNVVTYDTIITVSNPDLKLRPGMTANVSIIVARRDGVLRLANAALRLRVPEGVPVKRDEPPAAPAKSGEAAKAEPKEAAKSPAPAAGSGEGGAGRRRGPMANLTPEQRQKMRDIMAEVGVDFRAGPPTPEQREQMRKLMLERGLPVPENPPTSRPGEVVLTPRTVYRLAGTAPAQQLEAVAIKAGITDGSSTEVVEGLKEGDVVVTSVTVPNAASPRPATTNPFGGGRRF